MTLIGNRQVGEGQPVYIVAEIGINHNGCLELALELIDYAKRAGADAVKFQKRTPEIAIPDDQKNIMRDTPWGYISYLEYKECLEFGQPEFDRIAEHCRAIGIDWFASVWDKPSVEFMAQYNPIAYKIPSACITDDLLVQRVSVERIPIIMSTGMTTQEQIDEILANYDFIYRDWILMHCTSTYPCQPAELNLQVIPYWIEKYHIPVGYSGHEVGLVPSVAAVALGACMVERHITKDRTLWGTDQAASVEPGGFERLVKYIRVVEQALGDGVKRVYDSEIPSMRKLRKYA